MTLAAVRSPQLDVDLDIPLPIYFVQPPYECPQRVTHLSRLSPERLAPGTLFLLEVGRPDAAWPILQRAVPRLRQTFRGIPLVLWLPEDGRVAELAQLSRRVGHLGVRAELMKFEPVASTLRAVLTNPMGLERDVVEWLSMRGVRLTPDLAYLLEQVFLLAPQYRTLAGILTALRVPASSVGAKFSKRRLPPPSTWLHLAHALHAALRLQAEPRESVFRVALELGYSDHSALSRQLIRNFRMRPSEIRETLGWEWLLDRWLERMFAPGFVGLAPAALARAS